MSRFSDCRDCIDFIKCPKYRFSKGSDNKMTVANENIIDERSYSETVFPEWNNNVGSAQPAVNVERIPMVDIPNGRCDNFSKSNLSWSMYKKSSVHQNISEISRDSRESHIKEDMQEETFSSLKEEDSQDFQCPRCNKRMQEPRLLPCLHPICSPCVSELLDDSLYVSSSNSTYEKKRSNRGNIINCETCPICDFPLPRSNSPLPPPHYPLQHRVVMDAIRCRLVNRVLCDACPDEVVALVQCSTCLRNFCADCGMEHQQQVTMELKPSQHIVKPLWEATKVRRTALCNNHPTQALHFYCNACQQVICKECMWSSEHRGHAIETATGAGKRAAAYLSSMLKTAKAVLNTLLTQYDRDVFSNTLDDLRELTVSTDSR